MQANIPTRIIINSYVMNLNKYLELEYSRAHILCVCFACICAELEISESCGIMHAFIDDFLGQLHVCTRAEGTWPAVDFGQI